MSGGNKEELYRRLAQSRRLLAQAFDPLTNERLSKLVAELADQLAAVEARDADTPE